jgi:hypothetical protein
MFVNLVTLAQSIIFYTKSSFMLNHLLHAYLLSVVSFQNILSAHV